jgi:hypothetical protein
MEPDRFDDVELQVFEESHAPRRSSRWAVAIAAAVVATGALSAGASGDSVKHAAKPAAPAASHSFPCHEHGYVAAPRD